MKSAILARATFALLLLSSAHSCATAAPAAGSVGAVNAVLDDFHKAAAEADETRYFAHLAPDAVFLGTDATERWTKEAFHDWARPYFQKGKAWTFVPRSRNVGLSADGSTAWFDEVLDSASYGECRGTGVLQKRGGVWLVEQYNLTIPIPNDLAKDFVERIRAAGH